MTPEELKISLFQYALQGKLVEQRSDEGTAEDLYNEIKCVAEKDKNVISITEDELPFEIPSTWKWCRFGELVKYSMGKTPPRAEPIWWGNDIPWVSISDMSDYGHINATKESVSQQALNEKFGAISTTGTLIMSFKLTVGRTSILDIDALHNEAIISIYPFIDKSNFFRDYLFYVLPIITQWGESKNAIKGKTLNSKSISNLLVPLAPLEELHRIVEKIERIIPYIEKYALSYEKLEKINVLFPEEMKKSILQYAIQGKLVEQRPEEGTAEELYQQIQEEKQKLIKEGKIKKEKPLSEIAEDEIPFDIPETWKWVRLGEIYWYIDAGKSPNCEKRAVEGSEWGVITTTAIQTGFFDDKQNKVLPKSFDVKESMQIHVGDILITRAGPMNRTGVACNVERIQYNLILSDKTLRINMTDKYISKKYIVMLLNSPQIRNLLVDRMSGMDKQQVNISQDKYKTVLLPIPPLEEQYRIVKKVEELLPCCDRLSK